MIIGLSFQIWKHYKFAINRIQQNKVVFKMNKENLITLIDKLEKDIESVKLDSLNIKDKFFMLSELEKKLNKKGVFREFNSN